METVVRFLQRHPPRSGWLLFLLALATGLVLPVVVDASRFELAAMPTSLAVILGLVLPLWGGRRIRPLLLLLALLFLLFLVGLLPSYAVFAEDLNSLLRWRGGGIALRLPEAVRAAAAGTAARLQAAWQGDTDSLSWTIERLCALLAFAGAGVFGLGLRRRRFTLAWSLPLLAAQAAIGITTRTGMGYAAFGIFLTLLVSLLASFGGREHMWERGGFGFSDALRVDVAFYGAGLLGLAFFLGFIIPATPRNFVTTWIWSDVDLPPGLKALDNRRLTFGEGRVANRLPIREPAANLELGTSLEEGDREEIVLRVRAEGLDPATRPYWRGRTFAQYTGRGWTTGPIETLTVPPFASEARPLGYITQAVTDLRGGGRLRYGVADIVGSSEQATLEQTTAGEPVGWVGAEERYTVFSSPPGPIEDFGPEVIEGRLSLQSYAGIPRTVPDRVVGLARELTAGSRTQTDRALAIERYLRGLKYSYQVEPLPPGDDAVDQFIFSMRSGYCTYYASAMAVMARAVGIPSRVAVGYATGSYNAERGEFEVREQDAHAWPELYIEEQGWTRWEPTPIRPVPSRSMQPERPGVAAPQTA
ncbi:MAG TPA: transglutaminase domain-containing protein, partial [Herpetosiphonaceae bacterium]|nr:transglutaminase domain-containing protein [Herpetosiphonaceae bacterium]